MRARSARRLSVLPARTQLSSVERSSGVKVRVVGYLLMPHHDIERVSLQLSTRQFPCGLFAQPFSPDGLSSKPEVHRQQQVCSLSLLAREYAASRRDWRAGLAGESTPPCARPKPFPPPPR